MQFFTFHFSHFTFLLYLCTRLEKLRALSSAGSERLPYKQRVGGSNPSAPTFCGKYIKNSFGSLAQLNRASDYGSEGYRFESCRSHLIVAVIAQW